MRIHRASRRNSLTALNDWDPPFTCRTTQVRPCVGRTDPVFRGSQSIWFLNAPVTQPCISGLTQTWPSLHSERALSSTTFGWSSIVGSLTGRSDGSNDLTSQPSTSRSRAISLASLRLNDVSRREPCNTKMRGGCVSVAPFGTNAFAAAKPPGCSSAAMRAIQSSPGPDAGTSGSLRWPSQSPVAAARVGASLATGRAGPRRPLATLSSSMKEMQWRMWCALVMRVQLRCSASMAFIREYINRRKIDLWQHTRRVQCERRQASIDDTLAQGSALSSQFSRI